MSHNHHVQVSEYDLNIFYAEQYTEEDGTYWDNVYTIQPSKYVAYSDGMVDRRYLESFKLSLEETRAIAPDFPDNEYGSDFFIGLEYFKEQCKALPGRVNQILDTLPDIDLVKIDNDDYTDVRWLDVLFV
jgi:hypothetical protein